MFILRNAQLHTMAGPVIPDGYLSAENGKLEAAAIRPAIMSDHPEVPVQHLLLCAAMAVREGMSEDGALRAVALRAAEVCRIADRVGSMSPGEDADLIVLSGHPFSFSTRIDMTVIEGRIVHRRKIDA